MHDAKSSSKTSAAIRWAAVSPLKLALSSTPHNIIALYTVLSGGGSAAMFYLFVPVYITGRRNDELVSSSVMIYMVETGVMSPPKGIIPIFISFRSSYC